MAAISTVGSTQERVAKRFPRSRNYISVSGSFLLVVRCRVPWRIQCFLTAEARDQAWERMEFGSCGTYSCRRDHDRTDL
jgi:hypothetical protein